MCFYLLKITMTWQIFHKKWIRQKNTFQTIQWIIQKLSRQLNGNMIMSYLEKKYESKTEWRFRFNDEFLNVFKSQYFSHFYYMRVTESKIRSRHFVSRKTRDRFTKNENKQLFESTETISKSVYISYNYFSYFCVLNQHSNYNFHFFIYK